MWCEQQVRRTDARANDGMVRRSVANVRICERILSELKRSKQQVTRVSQSSVRPMNASFVVAITLSDAVRVIVAPPLTQAG